MSKRKDGSVTIKAHGGDRVDNLRGIARKIDEILPWADNAVMLSLADVRRIQGYAEQLRIIADELAKKPRKRG